MQASISINGDILSRGELEANERCAGKHSLFSDFVDFGFCVLSKSLGTFDLFKVERSPLGPFCALSALALIGLWLQPDRGDL